jgi:hypothetical protein
MRKPGVWAATLVLFLAGRAFGDPIAVPAATSGSVRADVADGVFDTIAFPGSILVRYDGTFVDRGSFEFDLSSLPAGVVTSATLNLITVSGFADDPFELYGYAGDGTTAPGDVTGGSLLASLPVDWQDTIANPSFDVTGFLQGLVASSAEYAGFYLKLVQESGGFQFMQFGLPADSGLVVDVREGTPPVVPEPSAIVLVLAGLAAFRLLRRR